MIDAKLEKALNQQINKELQAWYAYLSMTAYCKSLNLNGFAAFMDSHAHEEQAHAHRLLNYVLDRGANATGAAGVCAADPISIFNKPEIFDVNSRCDQSRTAIRGSWKRSAGL